MRIYTNTITERNIYEAAYFASGKGHGMVDVVECTLAGSRSHDHAYVIKLEGDGTVQRHRPNSGQSGAGGGYAAHYDSWGWVIAFLFRIDPTAKIGQYANQADFNRMTKDAFLMPEAVTV